MRIPPRPPAAIGGRSWRRPSRGALLVLALAIVIVIARSAVYTIYEQAFFDSDQAIVGLMARHLAEGRAFPLFYYGQTYMLVVDAWVAAPIFLLAGATVSSLHAALVLMNVVAVALMIVCLDRAGVRPIAAIAAVLYVALAPPLTTASLIEAGANIGPLIYVSLLWLLRRRPLWFGLVLGVGFLNREFTIYAVPVLLLGEVWSRTIWTRARVRFWIVAAAATLATWQGIQGLKPYSDMMGPGTRGLLVGGEAGSQVGNISDRVAIVPAELPGRLGAMVWLHLPGLWGARYMPDAIGSQGHRWLFWPMAAIFAMALIRVAMHGRRGPPGPDDGYGWYLLGTGVVAAAAYVLTRPADGVVHRYLLLTLFIPVGITALHLAHEPRRALRAITLAFTCVWALSSGVDHWHQVTRYWGGHEGNEMRDLANALEARGIHVAQSGYWKAYKLSFLTQERVKVASTDVVRIEEYQRLAREAGADLVTISDAPCPGGEAVSLWYLCRQ
jgi:hypothetical protein